MIYQEYKKVYMCSPQCTRLILHTWHLFYVLQYCIQDPVPKELHEYFFRRHYLRRMSQPLFFLSSFTAVGTTVAKRSTSTSFAATTTTKSITATAATVLSFSPYPHCQFSIAIAHMNVIFDDFQRILKQPSQFISVQFMVLTHNAKRKKKKSLSLSESWTTM